MMFKVQHSNLDTTHQAVAKIDTLQVQISNKAITESEIENLFD